MTGRHRFHRTTERLVYETPYIQFFDDDILRPDGSAGRYIRFRYRESESGVVVIPRLPNGDLILIDVHRYAADEQSLEFPRGSAKRGESHDQAAKRELQSEVSLIAKSTELLGHHRPDTSFVTTRAAVVVANVVDVPSDTELAWKEGVNGAHVITEQLFWAKISDGHIEDGFTLGAAALYHARGAGTAG